MLEIRKLAGKGNGIVATESIKAGTVVHREQPLMRLGSEFIDQYHGSTQKGTEGMLAAVSYFRNQMSVEDQTKYLSLHGADASGHFADNLRGFMDKIQIDGKPLTEAEKVKYIGVALILAFNAFGDSKDVRIYETASRFCHSCESNCTYALDGPEITVRALTCVQAGEELTLDYYASRRLQPTHVRRFKWLEVKDFTCCCPRCDAPGDDTRQFHCHDPECHGRHAVCQPLNNDPHLLPGMAYTGVEYVEPHLLPCTVCQRAPPAAYQTAMFQLEKKWNEALQLLPAILDKPTSFTFFLPDKHGRMASTTLLTGYPHRSEIPDRMQKLGSLHYQVTHVTGFFLAVHELRARFVLSKEGESGHKPRMLQLVTEMEPMLSCFYPLPYVQCATILIDMYCVYTHLGDTTSAAQVYKRLIRGERIRTGRDKSTVEIHFKIAVDFTGGFPSASAFNATPEESCCVYCEESPERAAMILSRCGACKKVVYCGAACQKAHWPLHKAQCKALQGSG
jgi:hypothetical protein